MAEGIMSLPESTEAPMEAAAPQLPPEEMQRFESALREYATQDPQKFGQDLLDSIGQADPQLVAQLNAVLEDARLPNDVVDALGQLVDILSSDPDNYEENRQDAIDEGIPSELMPETYDPAFFAAMNIALDKLSEKNSVRSEMPPMEFAEGGLATLKPMAAAIAAQGRGTDTMLAHITPSEARMLRRNGGSGTINPSTGLPEFGFFKSLFKGIGKVVKGVVGAVTTVVKGVVNVVKKVAENPIGRAILTVGATMLLGPGGALFGGAGLAGGIGLAAMPNLALAFNTMAASTLVNVAAGQKFGDALKGGLITGALAGGAAKVFNLTPEAYKTAAAKASAKTSGIGSLGSKTAAEGAKTVGINEAPVGEQFNPSTPSSDLVGEASKGVLTPSKAASQATASVREAAEKPFLSRTFGSAGEWVDKNIMPSGIREAGQQKALAAGQEVLAQGGTKAMANAAYQNALPGFLRTYGPIAAVGLGGAYALGAFDTPKTEPPPGFEGLSDPRYEGMTGYQLLEKDPEKWGFKRGELGTSYSGLDPYAANYAAYSPPSPSPSSSGIATLAGGGTPKHFPRKTGPIDGPGTGTSDSIPAMLSDGEFVFTAKAVRNAGGGSRRAGAKRMYALMKALEGNQHG